MNKDTQLIYEAYKLVKEADEPPPVEHKRVCSMCQQEFGIKPQKDQWGRMTETHGICRRHMIEMYQKLQAEGRDMSAKIKELEERPEESFCPDMAKEQKEKKLPGWAESIAKSEPDNYTGNQKLNYF